MAEKKNFTIENYNGTDYDTLYPETNSGQVLLDTTAQAATNLPSGATLDNALAILGNVNQFDNRYKVGDTVITTRTNLGNKWLLCNGESIASNDYPELTQTLPTGLCNFKERVQRNEAVNYTYTFAVRNRGNITEALVTDLSKHVWYINLSGGGTWEQIVNNDAQKIIAANNVFFRRYNGGIFYCDENSDPRLDESYNLLSGVSTNLIDVVY